MMERPSSGWACDRRLKTAVEFRQEGTKLAHFCSMKITQDVRDYAAKIGVSETEALERGMEEKAVEFRQAGAEVYRKL